MSDMIFFPDVHIRVVEIEHMRYIQYNTVLRKQDELGRWRLIPVAKKFQTLPEKDTPIQRENFMQSFLTDTYTALVCSELPAPDQIEDAVWGTKLFPVDKDQRPEKERVLAMRKMK